MMSAWGWFIAALCLSADVSDDAIRVRLEARAPGTGAIGRAAAIEKAEEAALVQVIKGYAAAEDLRPFRPILDRPERYILSCQVLEQKQVGASTHVEVEALIQDALLRTDLASVLLPLFPNPPKVVVVVADGLGPEGAEQFPLAGAAEEELCQTFREAGFEVVHPDEVRRICKGPMLVKRVQSGPEEAVKFARECLADVAVVGDAVVSAPPATPSSNLRASTARLTLRVLRSGDAKIVDIISAEAVIQSRDPRDAAGLAMADASAKVKRKVLVSTILGVAGAKASDSVIITVENIQNGEQWKALCAALRSQPGVTSVEELYYASGSGRLKVAYDGPLAPFVDAMTAVTYGGSRLEPHKVVNRDMLLGFVSR